MYRLGVDVGGSSVKIGLVDGSGTLSEVRRFPTSTGELEKFLGALASAARDYQHQHHVGGLGIGIPGLRSLESRTIRTSPNIPCLKDAGLEPLLAGLLGIPVLTENDANAGAYGEFVCGAGRGRRHMVYLTIGTGLGSGLILDGKLFVGTGGYAGELGHTVVDPAGRLCACGNRGCLETVVSAPGIVRTAMEMRDPGSSTLWKTSGEVFQSAVKGDPVAVRAFAETGRFLGIACANVINLLNPDIIVIGGGVMASEERLLAPAREEARRHAFADAFDSCRIVPAELGSNAGMIGAGMLAWALR